MASNVYQRSALPFHAGPLGHIEGLAICNTSDTKELIHYFGGLPYALPPVGPYRFRRPRPLPEYYRYGTKARPGNFTGAAAHCPQPEWQNTSHPILHDEDCLQLNIYIPAHRTPPKAGWPVFFFIHGGFLQWGNANMTPEALTRLLTETAFEAIVVMPAYRLNLFGFLAGRELQSEADDQGEVAGNMGFWDQRLALEWTAKNIVHFGGDSSNITIGGYSAGSHSAFHQLAHELYFVSDKKAIIRRTIMWSNSPGVQPRTFRDHQKQFDELLSTLKIPISFSAGQRLKALRAVSCQDLVAVQNKLKISEFRATSDGSFVHKNLIAHINSGDFARRMKARGIKLMNGECRDEHNLYRNWRTPSQSYDAVLTRLTADYPESVVRKLMQHRCGDSHALPAGVSDWQELFGRVYADMQVHCLERGFYRALERGGLTFGQDILRYRFDWRASCASAPNEWGVTHGTDMSIWFWGMDDAASLTHADQQAMMPFNEAFAAFVKGEQPPQWQKCGVRDVLRLRSDGKTDIWRDDSWERGLRVWELVNGNAGPGVIDWIKARL